MKKIKLIPSPGALVCILFFFIAGAIFYNQVIPEMPFGIHLFFQSMGGIGSSILIILSIAFFGAILLILVYLLLLYNEWYTKTKNRSNI